MGNVPPRELDWPAVRQAAGARWGMKRLRPGLPEILEALFQGRDVLGILPPGADMAPCSQLPALFLPPAVVVSARAAPGAPPEVRHVTPEELAHPEHLARLQQTGVSLLVVEDVQGLAEQLPALRDAAAALGHPPILALSSATTAEGTPDLRAALGIPDARVVHTDLDRPNLRFQVFPTVNLDAKHQRLLHLLEQGGSSLVYVSSARAAEEVWEWLQARGVAAGRCHGKLKTHDRDAAQARFLARQDPVLVVTGAWSPGGDLPDLRRVVHFHFPDSLERYCLEAGRAGQDGQPAAAALLYQLDDRRLHGGFRGSPVPPPEEWLRLYQVLASAQAQGSKGLPLGALAAAAGLPERKAKVLVSELESMGMVEVGKRVALSRAHGGEAELTRALQAREDRARADLERLEAMMRYAECTLCRVRFLKSYFELPAEQDCGQCDNCVHPPAQARRIPATRRRPADDEALPTRDPFHPGERVRHATFGEGEVKGVDDHGVSVAFSRAGLRKVTAKHLERPALG